MPGDPHHRAPAEAARISTEPLAVTSLSNDAATYLVEWRIAWVHPDGGRRQLERGQEAICFQAVRAIVDAHRDEAIGSEFYVTERRQSQPSRSVCGHACEIAIWEQLPERGAIARVGWPDEARREAARCRIYQTIVTALNEAMCLRLVQRRLSREMARAVRTLLFER